MPRTIDPDRKIRLAIVGCGRIAEKHFNAASHHAEDVDVVADVSDQVGIATKVARLVSLAVVKG